MSVNWSPAQKDLSRIIMKHSSIDIKWFYRGFLIVLVITMTYLVTQPSYNFSHWVPRGFLKSLNIPYKMILYSERHIDKALHFFGAAIIVWLISKAQILSIKKRGALGFTLLLCLAAECVQLQIGRGFNSIDLLLGILGSFMAYLSIKENKHIIA